jgi:hypothetical protein
MKHVVASLTIGACLLLSSAGDVFADNPHPVTPSVGGGQLGTVGPAVPSPNGGTAACAGGGGAGSPPGQLSGSSNSPFVTSKAYAGAGSGNYGAGKTAKTATPDPNPHANSQYDNACLRQML